MNVRGVPARLIVFGDVSQAAKVLPLAQDLAERLWDANRYFVKQRILGPNGEKICAEVNRAARFVRLTIESGLDFVSGLVRLSNSGLPIHTILDSSGKAAGLGLDSVYRRNAKVGGQVVLDTPTPLLEPTVAKNLHTGGLENTQYLIPYSYSVGPYGVGVDNDKNLLYRRSGLYTGLMRQVVQMLIGQGKKVYYDFKFSLSHGVFKAADGTLWLIEISQSSGIRAKKLPIVKRGKQSDSNRTVSDELLNSTSLGAIPRGEKSSSTLFDKDFIQLAPAGVLAEFYKLSPFFQECGWAFSYSGHEAQNTAYDVRDITGVGQNTDHYCFRYKITIAEANNTPVSASIQVVEEGWIYGPNTTTVKFPFYPFTTCLSLVWNTAHTMPETDVGIYVFYDGDIEKVLRMKTGYGPVSVVSIPSDPSYYSGADIPYSMEGKVHYVGGGTSSTHSPPELYMTGFREAFQGYDDTGTQPEIATVESIGSGAFHPFSIGCQIDTKVGKATVNVVTNGTRSASADYSATIPLFEREAVFIQRRSDSVEGGYMGDDYNRFTVVYGGSSPRLIYSYYASTADWSFQLDQTSGNAAVPDDGKYHAYGAQYYDFPVGQTEFHMPDSVPSGAPVGTPVPPPGSMGSGPLVPFLFSSETWSLTLHASLRSPENLGNGSWQMLQFNVDPTVSAPVWCVRDAFSGRGAASSDVGNIDHALDLYPYPSMSNPVATAQQFFGKPFQ